MDYLVNTDGGSRGNPGPAGFGFTISDGDGHLLLERAGFLGRATNNVAEYMAVVVALEEIGAADPSARVTVRADSKLVVEQLSGSWKIKNADLQQLALRARRAHPPAQVRYVWVPRAENAAADALANRAMDEQADYTRGQLTSRAGTGDDVGDERADGSGRAGAGG
ncbi:MAG TPA: reverse transcriptase-like protein, partial [Actinomycetales bacterium]|nr:reverse transcriptase-like protein [Actinomycetales bacterium]